MNTNTLSLQQYHLRRLLLAFLTTFTLISCVTINIYFPAAAAEEAAEKIVDEVLNTGEPDTKPDQGTNNSQSLNRQNDFKNQESSTTQALIALVDFFIPAAEAGQADISIDSPKIRSIRNSMQKRQNKLRPYYQSGAVGFTNNGLIASVNNKGLSVKQKSTVNKLIKSENNDRMRLYKEMANANGHPEWQADIQKTFSKTWINKISKGWMYQTSSGQWTKK